MSDIIIGIDLGTTNSEVAVVKDGQPRVIEVDGSPLLPSVVGLADDGALLVGHAARNQYALHPERTVRSIKRRMGEDGKAALGEREYTPQEVSALILRHLKQAAERDLGEPVERAVITVPAYFSDAQRQATRDAGELAGLKVARIINEPTAAALAYEVDHQEQRTILVYDLGGGTFDVSVVRTERDVTEVLSSHGNNHLGGDDFDQKIIDHLVTHLRDTHSINPASDATAMARITRAAEAAKITLSDAPYARIEEEFLLDKAGSPVHLSLELDRLDYEAMIEPLIAETLEAVHTALQGAGLSVSALDEILLVGGATRTPLIQRRLEEQLGMQPRAEVDPDLCVASGAAIQAAITAGQSVGSVLVDVTPYTFGTSALGDLDGEIYSHLFVPLIRKNTPIPTTKSEAFVTAHDGQQLIEVKVYQGEHRDALNNTEIGSFRVEGLSDVPSGNPITLTFSLDLDGILHVTALEKRSGLQKQIHIDNATARFEQQEMAAARDRLDALIEADPTTPDAAQAAGQQENRSAAQVRALIEKAERLMESASPQDREDLVDLNERLRDALENQDDRALDEARDELSDLIFYLES